MADLPKNDQWSPQKPALCYRLAPKANPLLYLDYSISRNNKIYKYLIVNGCRVFCNGCKKDASKHFMASAHATKNLKVAAAALKGESPIRWKKVKRRECLLPRRH